MRPQLYLLASGLFNQPTHTRLKGLHSLFSELLSAMPTDAPWRKTLIALEPHLNYNYDKNIEVEYSRLFILAFPNATVQPYGSYWLETEQCLMGRSTMEVKEMMAEYGIEVAENTGLLPDHIVSELEFMAYLANQDDEKAVQTQRQLLEHLVRWTPQFIAALKKAEPAPYYQLAADFLDQLINSDVQELNSPK
jgi:TorA maturation chaperone TorD